MTIELGAFERVDLRDIWADEARDFTPWLAEEQNLAALGKSLGIDLELVAMEQGVGRYSADILCSDGEGNNVVIENQLNATDHSHVGQLITYAAGLHATKMIWIASNFTDEHRAAIDWLNDSTNEHISFFGLEIELWRIGSSSVAPKFNIVCQPNKWTKFVTRTAKQLSDGTLSETALKQLEYWTVFNDLLRDKGSIIKPRLPQPDQYMFFGVGRTGFRIGGTLLTSDKCARVEIQMYDDHADEYFELLEDKKVEIEESLGFALEWMPLPEKKTCRITFTLGNVDPLNPDERDRCCLWMKEHLEKFKTVFQPIIRDFDLGKEVTLTGMLK